MDQGEITKFENELAAEDNTELKEGIQKLSESGLEYLTDFCKLHKVNMKGTTISEIITNMLKDSVVNDHIQIRLGKETDKKEYLWKKVKAFKSAKLEEIIETQMELINVSDPTETKPTQENYKEQIEELKTVIKKMKEATKKDVSNLNEGTKDLKRTRSGKPLQMKKTKLL